MFTFEDQRSVLGRVAARDALVWPSPAPGLGHFRPPSPWGHDLESRWWGLGIHPDAPAFRTTAPRSAPRPFEISAKLLARIYPRLSSAKAAGFVGPLNVYLERYQIDSVCRMAAFFGQVGVECTELTQLQENLLYTTEERLTQVFPTAMAGQDPSIFLRHPDKLANRAYANRNGNGDEASGDGSRFKGRGLLHLTGRANYAGFASATGIDVVQSPELVGNHTYAVWSACWFWSTRRLNPLADQENWDELTKRINQARLDQSLRLTITRRARDEIRTEVWNAL